MRPSQAGTKLERTQTAAALLRISMQTIAIYTYELIRCKKQSRMTSLLELVVFLAPPLRPDADRPCATWPIGAVSTVELM